MRILLVLLPVLLLPAAEARADDTEIYRADYVSGSGTGRPKVLIIFDNSGAECGATIVVGHRIHRLSHPSQVVFVHAQRFARTRRLFDPVNRVHKARCHRAPRCNGPSKIAP